MQLQIQTQVRRFYDGGLDADPSRPEVPPDPNADPQIVLRRLTDAGLEQFAMDRRIAYRDRHLGELLVPSETGSFRTDLTSVPALFTWLVPKTGRHLPATLLHDGLVYEPGTPPTYVSTEGVDVKRAEADRVLRDAMADAGTGVVRRWLVWSAVTAVTMLSGAGTGEPRGRRWYYRCVVAGTVLLIALLGACATLDLFDVSVRWLPQLPWMGDRAWWQELIGGFAGTVVVPGVLGLLWGRFRIAGWIIGISLAVLLHVTLVLLVLTAGYQSAEWLARKAPVVAVAGAYAAVVASVVVFIALVV
ncbi:MAG: DUF1353 domain-containing protein [Nocardioidaceae bacterium]